MRGTQPLKHKICHINDIEEGKAKGFEIEGKAIFLVKRNDTIYGYANACPHLGVELEWTEDEFLDADGELIRCHLHGALFNIEDGYCINGPCEGEKLQPLQLTIESSAIYLNRAT